MIKLNLGNTNSVLKNLNTKKLVIKYDLLSTQILVPQQFSAALMTRARSDPRSMLEHVYLL
jgi:hypothetical protein